MDMRKWMLVLAILIAAVTFGSTSANAQTQISIGPIQGTNQAVIFTGDGGTGATMTFGACGGGPCTIHTQDQFLIAGANDGLFSASTLITTPGPASYSLTSSNGANWSVSGPTMAYSFSSGAGNLTGTVTWSQVNTNGSADLVGTIFVTGVSGGSDLSTYYTVGDTYIIRFAATYAAGNQTLEGIFGTTLTAMAGTNNAGESGSIGITPTPEPTAMLLYGTGIFLIGGILRRRLV
jgi:hypothetical protein